MAQFNPSPHQGLGTKKVLHHFFQLAPTWQGEDGQAAALQSCVCTRLGHGSPLPTGATVTLRRTTWTPPPHGREQFAMGINGETCIRPPGGHLEE